MNRTNVINYIKFAYWAVKSQQSIEDCLKLNDSVETIAENVKNIINDTTLNEEIFNMIPGLRPKKKPVDCTNECILKNMEAYDTTNEEAQQYESHCHNCGDNTSIGQKYCGKGCFKFIEEFNYDCFWGKSCKMCHTHNEYIIMTRSFEFSENTYWIDNENNVYNNKNKKIAMEKDGNIVY